MNRTELENIVRAATARVMQVDQAGLSMETRWTDDLSAKSMQRFMIVALLQEATDLEIPMSLVFRNDTLADTVDMLQELRAAKGQ